MINADTVVTITYIEADEHYLLYWGDLEMYASEILENVIEYALHNTSGRIVIDRGVHDYSQTLLTTDNADHHCNCE